MNSLKRHYFNEPFSHIYIEEEILTHERTQKILKKFPQSEQIIIRHYKDVFCRKRQKSSWQAQVPMLILAKKREHWLYPGAPVCQNFEEPHFYYTSCVMNCLYQCEYCYLKGMYPSGNLVVFVNLEDTFLALEKILKQHPVYLCISYDTDLMALESMTGFVEEWISFAGRHENLKLECRTKCGRQDLWQRFTPQKNVIFAFTISPEAIRIAHEKQTSSLKSRLDTAKLAMDAGFMVRLCFDPMIYIPDWKKHYGEMVDQVGAAIAWTRLYDVSIGSFRISQDYLKRLRKENPDSSVVWFPFENEGGVYQYPRDLRIEMEQFLAGTLKKYLSEKKIFLWK